MRRRRRLDPRLVSMPSTIPGHSWMFGLERGWGGEVGWFSSQGGFGGWFI